MKKYGNKVVFQGGSPEKQIELITQQANENDFRGSVKFQKSPKNGKIYLIYMPEKTGFQHAVSGLSSIRK